MDMTMSIQSGANIMKIGYNDILELDNIIQQHRAFLRAEYGSVVPYKILKEYLPPEKSVIVNDDPDMYPIELKLPEPPMYHLIDGFGLKKEEQYWRAPQMPYKLKDLLKTSKTYVDVIEKLDNNTHFYREEILWILKQWHYRLYGYWFYNNGVPTYIDGWHFFYCGYWHLDVGLPTFRYRDKLFFLFARYCSTATTAPFFYRVPNDLMEDGFQYFANEKESQKYIGQSGLNVRPEKGFWVLDYERRICYGFNYPKHRREGATYRGNAMNFEVTSRQKDVSGVLQSMGGESAETAFSKKMINPAKNLPFFFLPKMASSISSAGLVFDTMVSRAKKDGMEIMDNSGLSSTVHPSSSPDERKEDGNKFVFVHGDEVGKSSKNNPYNITVRYEVMKKTIAQGSNIFGFVLHTSTSENTKGDAGRRYMELCKNSHWHERDFVTGQTKSGLFNLYTPATINYEGYEDKYGNPILKDPTPEQKKKYKIKFGSEKFIEAKRNQLLESPEQYYEEIREYPTRFRECFLGSGEESGFDIMKITERINQIDMSKDKLWRTGNFSWTDGYGSSVEFIDDPNGRFELSYFPSTSSNLYHNNGKLYAGNKELFVAACDPFRFDDTRKKRRSKGAGAVYMYHDEIIDPPDKPKEDWVSERFVCTYSNAVSEDEYKEDMLKMTIFFGCEMYPEMNEEMVYKFFRDSKYNNLLGYLYFNGLREKLPGFYTHATMKQRMFKLWKEHVEKNLSNEKHRSILQELSDIEGMRDMVNYDLFAAGGGCLLAKMYRHGGSQKSRVEDLIDKELEEYMDYFK